MRKLLNTLYVTSENSYLALDGENVVLGRNCFLRLQRNQSGINGSVCRTEHIIMLFDTAREVSGKSFRKN